MAMATDQAAQQLRQLGDVNGYAPCLVPRHQNSQQTGVQAHFRNKRKRARARRRPSQ